MGDDSLEIYLVRDLDVLIETLNNLILPERLTAVWHLDDQALEIIYTVFPVTPEESARSFTFTHKDNAYRCEFRDSSKRVLMIAESAFPAGPSSTDFRNLMPFSDYVFANRGVKGVR